MSLGGLPLKALCAAIRDAVKGHLLAVCAAGNKIGITVWPAGYSDSIAVAASNIDDQAWFWTSGGLVVDISAPGEDVWKADTDPLQPVTKGSGTSYATAQVAGCAALWLANFGKDDLRKFAVKNNWKLQEVFRAKVIATARTPAAGWNTWLYGAGIVNAEELLTRDPRAILSGAVDAASARRTQPDQNDHLGLAIAAANKLLEETMAPKNRASIPAFEHELATIFLDEANERDLNYRETVLASVTDVIKRRGSMTLKSAAKLN